jgi:hypothetical protein
MRFARLTHSTFVEFHFNLLFINQIQNNVRGNWHVRERAIKNLLFVAQVHNKGVLSRACAKNVLTLLGFCTYSIHVVIAY